MSWTSDMTKETFEDKETIYRVFRPKTSKYIEISFTGPEEPIHIISKVKLHPREALIYTSKGLKDLVVIFGDFYPTGLGVDSWDYKPYQAFRVITRKKFLKAIK